ncbi:hypothetical protein J3R83DRAFT_7212 [Lanmaoa asiatica]|nr:hypothetical protein J3R83DRAFT_7212 [Lanmaoa asiatica]
MTPLHPAVLYQPTRQSLFWYAQLRPSPLVWWSRWFSSLDCQLIVRSEPLDALAVHIWRSVGLSGRNKDYLYQLAESMRALAPASQDAHLFTLEVGRHFSLSLFSLVLHADGSSTTDSLLQTLTHLLLSYCRTRSGS